MSDITYNIVEHLAVLSESKNGWKRELNLVSWNDRPPKYDVRDWAPDYSRMSKGLTFSEDEAKALIHALGQHLNSR